MTPFTEAAVRFAEVITGTLVIVLPVLHWLGV